MEQVLKNIAKMSVNGNRLELPQDEQFSNYAKIKQVLTKAGGKYKKLGFEFTGCAQAIKDRLCGGEQINLKKQFQFFPTPNALAARMADILDVQEGETVLEPSGGSGALILAVHAETEFPVPFYTMDLDPERVKELEQLGNVVVEQGDFLEFVKGNPGHYPKIIANPPFTNNQDVDHILAMHSILAEGGRLVTVAGQSWLHGQQKKQIAFREWLDEVGAEVEELPAATFKESGTTFGTVLITINK